MVNPVRWLRSKGARIALVGLGCAWLGWSIIANTMADSLAESDPEAALTWRSSHSGALVAVAEQKLRSDDARSSVPAIESLARAALRADPLQERALRDLAFAAELEGDAADAEQLMAIVDRRTRRDVPAQIWLFSRSLAESHFGEVLAHADALLRIQPDLAGDLGPALVALAGNREARNLLLARLAVDPPWRPWLLGQVSQAYAESSPALIFGIYSRLADSGSPPTNDELRPFLNQLVATEQYELGFLTWLHFLPGGPGQPISYVYNGDFERPVRGLPFDWIVSAIRGATTEVVTVPPDGNHVLKVEFANTRVPYQQVSKLLLLPPGSYRLSGQARAEGLDNERGLEWQISCADGDKQSLVETARLSGTSAWQPFAVEFQVPQARCRAQWLRLQLAARTALEQQIGGVVFYDDLTIEREASK